ncbi:gliding motility-associated C-terminal domain-containing protein [Olleya sp. R77988]|uniref:T9SS type B sorting domain-containing protein n=1 Tax=Olleya sp. R77988 TaxID=3093875 RepID=UPI0037CB13A3
MHLEYEASGNSTAIASAISPAIDLSTAVDGAELSFWMHAFGDNLGTLNVGVSTSQTGPFTPEYTWIGDYQTTADEAWVPIGINLDAYLGQVIYVEFSYGGEGSGFEGDMSIDQVRVETCGNFCIAPSNITATSITETSADISWTPSEPETQWNYVIQPAGTGTPTSGTTVSTTTVSETGLSPATDYEVYVQAICGADTSVWAGPFNFSTLLQFNFTLDCAVDGPQTISYCYDNNDTNVFTFSSTDGTPLNLTINAGQVENNFDEVIVLDSDGITDLNVATPYGAAGQISGLTFQSTGGTISFQVQSDGSVNCQGNGYPSINLTVSCATCINPTATFVVVDDCANGNQFLVDVDITSLGDATSLSIVDNQGSTPVSVSATGVTQFGPYPFNTPIDFTVSNEQDINCVINSQSISLAACPPVNDNPCSATVALVNPDESCTVITSGTLIEATDSGVPNGTCTTNADDDVWFEFTAVGDQQIIQIQNVVGGFNVDHALYEGTNCNNLTQMYCTTDDFSLTPALVIGNTYYIRVFSAGSDSTSITFDLCIQTLGIPTYCTDALPICPDLPDPFPNVSDGSTAPFYLDYDCLGSQPNPYWNTINVDLAGDYSFTLEQTSLTGNLIDIDFIVWGPFSAQDAGCFDLLSQNIEDCSYSATATETVTITGAPADSVYVILITNFNGSDGTYTFSMDSGPVNGINCDVVCDVTLDYDGIVIEQGLSAPDGSSDDIDLCGYTSVLLTADTAYTVDSYDWYVDGIYQNGVNTPTFTATQSGQYQCIVGGGICADFTSSLIADINFFDAATAQQAPALEVCDDGSGNGVFDLESQTATILGTQSSTDFVITYYANLADAQSGMNPLTSPYTAVDGTTIYVRAEDVDAVGSMSGCASTNTNYSLVVNTTPNATQPLDLESCDDGTGNATFDLTEFEATTIGGQTGVVVSYHETEQDALDGTSPIATPTTYTSAGGTIYIRVENIATGCFKTTFFNLSVLPKPLLGLPDDILGCDNDDDGISDYDLTTNEMLLANGQTDLAFTYYLDLADAESSTGAIADPVNYMSGATTIYVRAENMTTGCFETSMFDLYFGITPETTFPTDIVYEVCPNATVPIIVTAEAVNYTESEVSIKWYNEGVEVPGQTSLDLPTVLTQGTYSIEVTFNDTGCASTTDVFVDELETCVIPQGISPNGDGINDNFDLSSYDVQTLEIYNRNGRLVYSKENYSMEWGGQSNDGDMLPVGTYYYVMKYQGTKTKAAWVYINR